MNFKPQALQNIRPYARWTVDDDVLIWNDTEQSAPTEDELNAEISRLQAEYDAQEYARLRSSEYPPITDYLDGVVKGDQAQIDAYIAACLAVKAKYPKV